MAVRKPLVLIGGVHKELPTADSFAVGWAWITDKPATFPPSAHTHPISDITNLQTSLDAKASLSGATFTGDITTYRSATPGTGVVYLGNSGARYLFYDGSNYIMPSADLYVNGWKAWTAGTFDPASKLNYRAPLDTVAAIISDWNTATTNGWYMASGALNAPTPTTWYIGKVTVHNSLWMTQEVWDFTNGIGGATISVYRRQMSNGTWGAWTTNIYTNGTTSTSALAVNGTATAFGAQATIHGATGVATALNLWQAGVGTMNIGILANTNSVRVVNSWADGTLAGGVGIDIATDGRVWMGGAAGVNNFERLSVAGGIFSQGANAQLSFQDRSTNRKWTWYSTGDVLRLYNDSADVIRFGIGGGAAFGTTLSTQISTYLRSAGRIQIGHAGAASAGSWYDGATTEAQWFAGLENDDSWGMYNSTNSWCWHIDRKGVMYVQNANSQTRTRQPRTFVQSADPGAAAADGDLWFW